MSIVQEKTRDGTFGEGDEEEKTDKEDAGVLKVGAPGWGNWMDFTPFEDFASE